MRSDVPDVPRPPFQLITTHQPLSRPFQEALGWKRSLKDYISLNSDKVKGLS